MNGGYLTSSQAARALGVSKRTVLNAVASGDLRAVFQMPGGAFRFMLPDVERYAQRRLLEQQRRQQERKVLLRSAQQAEPGGEASVGLAPSDSEASADSANSHRAGVPGASVTPWIERLSAMTADGREDAGTVVANILMLLADSLQVGMTLLARIVDGAWLVESVYDRAGMGLRSGDRLPHADILARVLSAGGMATLIAEDIRDDVRFTPFASTPEWRIGAATAIALNSAQGGMFGALCTLHPHSRTVPSGEISVLRLAGKMVMQAFDASVARASEYQAMRQLARYAAMVEELAQVRQQQAEEARAMAAVGVALASSLDLEELYRLILEQAAQLLPYDLAGVMHYDGEWAVVMASAGTRQVAAGTRFSRRSGNVHPWDTAPGVTTYLPDVTQEPYWHSVDSAAAAMGLRSLVHIPLAVAGVDSGFLGISSLTPNCYTDRQVRLAGAIGEWATQAMRNARLHETERARVRASEELIRVREASADALRTLSMAVEQNPASVVISSPDGTIEYVNPMFCRLTGYSKSEALGKSVLMQSSGLMPPAVYHELWETISSGEPWSGSLLNKTKTGETYWEQASIWPIRNDDATIAHFVAVKEDISERKRAEEQVRQSEERYRRIVETAQEGIWQVDAAGSTTFVNARMAEMLGYHPEEMAGQFPWAFVPESDVPMAKARQQRRAEGVREAAEVRYLRKNGGILWARLQSFPLVDELGVCTGAVAMIADVTDQRELDSIRSRLAAIVESLPHAIIALSVTGCIESWNEGATSLYGYGADEAIGRPVSIIAPDGWGDDVTKTLAGVLAGQRFSRIETKRRHKDGHILDVMVTIAPMRDAEGTIAGISSIASAINEGASPA
jgi:PAS domain S-box-containing protein/excisionase family DNA binding protein